MLKKPIILTLLLIVISLGLSLILGFILLILGLKNNAGISGSIPIFAALCVGQIYAKKYKIEIPKNEKFKIAFYYFLIQIVICIWLFILLRNSPMLIPIVVTAIILSAFVSLLIYLMLGSGCRSILKTADKNLLLKAQMMANPAYAKSIIVDSITPKETELPDVKYCQYCGAEFSANENKCPICEKLND